MRVLHVGNIANNAYNNVKFLRRKGVEADVLSYDYRHIMSQPEWEDAVFEGNPDEFEPEWQKFDLGAFQRPPWFIQETLNPPGLRRKQRFKGQFRLERLLFDLPDLFARAYGKYLEGARSGSKPPPRLVDILQFFSNRKSFQKWYQDYDLIQGYATEPINAWMFAAGRPYVAFEHGTMREIPFEKSARGRLLALAYRKAGRVFITNPDVVAAAERLGLKNYQFIPHPIDETKYIPRRSPVGGVLRNRYQTDFILFAPSRHNWSLKGNNLAIRAFSRFLKCTKGGSVLVLCEWGQEVAQSRQLIAELEIDASVSWIPPLNKMKLIDFYNAADLVLDQFTIGTFGTVTPEAMSCGRPVLMHFDRSVHEWCYSDMPPIVSARTEDEIFQALLALYQDPGRRASIGQASREWILNHHGWELVTDRQIALYRDLLQQ